MNSHMYKGRKNFIGNSIRKYRKLRKLTQEQLAAKMQLNEVILDGDKISDIERDKRMVTDFELFTFSKVLGVSMADLIEESQ